MNSDIISSLYTSYTKRLISYIQIGIPVLIISYLYIVYATGGVSAVYATFSETTSYPSSAWWFLLFLVVGLIHSDDLDGDRFVILGRVSSPGQMKNADFGDRLQPIRDHIIQEQEGHIVEEFTGSESGATMDRESLIKIRKMAEEDQFDVLAVRNLDRLSRAVPWDAIGYLLELRETGVILYEHPEKYFAWDDTNDYQTLSQAMVTSREWYSRISEGRQYGVFTLLKQGRWPLTTHFGYKKQDHGDDERNIFLNVSKAEILYRIFETYERTHNIAQTTREINDRFEDELDEKLTESRMKTVLSSKLCIGELSYEGVTKRKIDDLSAVPRERFNRVQSILSNNSRTTPNKIPEPIAEITSELGIKYVQSILEQISFRRCKKCGGELEPYSKTEVWNIPVEKVRCTSCDYDGALISEKEFREIHQTAPLSCPFCYETGDFEVEKSKHGLGMWKYKCGNCERHFHAATKPGKIERYLKNSDLGIKLGNKKNTKQGQSSKDSPDQASVTQYSLQESVARRKESS